MAASLDARFTEGQALLVLDSLAECGNLSKACRDNGVTKQSFLRWCDADPKHADQYTRAREAGLDTEADNAITEALQAQDAALGRLALDARKWYLSKLMPKKYGDKVAIGGAADLPAIQTQALDTTSLSEDVLRAVAGAQVVGETLQ